MNKIWIFAVALLAAAADQEADVRNSILHEISDLKEVRFQYNSDMLTNSTVPHLI